MDWFETLWILTGIIIFFVGITVYEDFRVGLRQSSGEKLLAFLLLLFGFLSIIVFLMKEDISIKKYLKLLW